MDAGDAADLPWNTTKTALDTDHPIYRRVRQEMINLGRPVINFLNKVKQEIQARQSNDDENPGPLESMVANAHLKPLSKVSHRTTFEMPKVKRSKGRSGGEAMQKIIFERPVTKAGVVRERLGVSSWREVGEEVFDY